MGNMKCWLAACAIMCVAATAVTATPGFKDVAPQVSVRLVDDMIRRYKEKIRESGDIEGIINIDDININIPVPFTEAEISATGGTLRNVLTVERNSHVEVETNKYSGAVSLKTSLRFDDLKIAYGTLTIKLPLLDEQTAYLEVDLSDGAIQTKIIVDEPCRAYLKEIKFLYFKKFVPHVNGLNWNILDSLAELIIKGVGEYLETFSKPTIERYFYHQLKEAVENIDVCNLDPIYQSQYQDQYPSQVNAQ